MGVGRDTPGRSVRLQVAPVERRRLAPVLREGLVGPLPDGRVVAISALAVAGFLTILVGFVVFGSASLDVRDTVRTVVARSAERT